MNGNTNILFQVVYGIYGAIYGAQQRKTVRAAHSK